MSVVIVIKVEVIYLGFGFLFENSWFVFMCEECNIIFIGFKSVIIDVMGNKINVC